MNFKISKSHALLNTGIALMQITLFVVVITFLGVAYFTSKIENKNIDNNLRTPPTPTSIYERGI